MERFKDNNDGTVTDKRTNLIWLKSAKPCDVESWADAIAFCSSLASGTARLADGSAAGQWRLPNIQELQGIGTDPPSIWTDNDPPFGQTWTRPGEPFTNVQPFNYWSGTNYCDYTDFAWFVCMINGYTNGSVKSYYFYVWPVRSGN